MHRIGLCAGHCLHIFSLCSRQAFMQDITVWYGRVYCSVSYCRSIRSSKTPGCKILGTEFLKQLHEGIDDVLLLMLLLFSGARHRKHGVAGDVDRDAARSWCAAPSERAACSYGGENPVTYVLFCICLRPSQPASSHEIINQS